LISGALEQIQHGVFNGSAFTWDTQTEIPGAIASGRQDPSVTWTGKWLIATWWDDTAGSNSDNVFMNWTTDKTGQSGWLSSAIQMTTTNQNPTQVNIRHSAKLGATRSTNPPDVAGAVDSSGKVYIFWATSVSGGAIKYATLASPFTSPSAATTVATSGTQPRYPHLPAQAPLTGGYVPLVYQTGTGNPYSIVLQTAFSIADTAPPTVPGNL